MDELRETAADRRRVIESGITDNEAYRLYIAREFGAPTEPQLRPTESNKALASLVELIDRDVKVQDAAAPLIRTSSSETDVVLKGDGTMLPNIAMLFDDSVKHNATDDVAIKSERRRREARRMATEQAVARLVADEADRRVHVDYLERHALDALLPLIHRTALLKLTAQASSELAAVAVAGLATFPDATRIHPTAALAQEEFTARRRLSVLEQDWSERVYRTTRLRRVLGVVLPAAAAERMGARETRHRTAAAAEEVRERHRLERAHLCRVVEPAWRHGIAREAGRGLARLHQGGRGVPYPHLVDVEGLVDWLHAPTSPPLSPAVAELFPKARRVGDVLAHEPFWNGLALLRNASAAAAAPVGSSASDALQESEENEVAPLGSDSSGVVSFSDAVAAWAVREEAGRRHVTYLELFERDGLAPMYDRWRDLVDAHNARAAVAAVRAREQQWLADHERAAAYSAPLATGHDEWLQNTTYLDTLRRIASEDGAAAASRHGSAAASLQALVGMSGSIPGAVDLAAFEADMQEQTMTEEASEWRAVGPRIVDVVGHVRESPALDTHRDPKVDALVSSVSPSCPETSAHAQRASELVAEEVRVRHRITADAAFSAKAIGHQLVQLAERVSAVANPEAGPDVKDGPKDGGGKDDEVAQRGIRGVRCEADAAADPELVVARDVDVVGFVQQVVPNGRRVSEHVLNDILLVSDGVAEGCVSEATAAMILLQAVEADLRRTLAEDEGFSWRALEFHLSDMCTRSPHVAFTPTGGDEKDDLSWMPSSIDGDASLALTPTLDADASPAAHESPGCITALLPAAMTSATGPAVLAEACARRAVRQGEAEDRQRLAAAWRRACMAYVARLPASPAAEPLPLEATQFGVSSEMPSMDVDDEDGAASPCAVSGNERAARASVIQREADARCVMVDFIGASRRLIEEDMSAAPTRRRSFQEDHLAQVVARTPHAAAAPCSPQPPPHPPAYTRPRHC
eukprot:TRINITY_DN15048_c0_g2_i1.p1 TRINITY_DN15048_c0_g2~~TRINITY_DN15048_c0_g2_i1.p1  ORF type:complete len:979 (+),score=175.58 TRINITY_DN15048_c0_g2_i1:122-3058(+)